MGPKGLEHHLAQLDDQIKEVERSQRAILLHLNSFQRDAEEATGNVRSVHAGMGKLQTAAGNVDKTRRKFQEHTNRSEMLQDMTHQLAHTSDDAELLRHYDELHDSWKALSKTSAGSQGASVLQRQLQVAAELRQKTFAKLRDKYSAAVGLLGEAIPLEPYHQARPGQEEYHRLDDSAPPLRLLPDEDTQLLRELLQPQRLGSIRRELTQEFVKELADCVRKTIVAGALPRQEMTESMTSAKTYEPGTHYILFIVRFWRKLVRSMQHLAEQIFGPDWISQLHDPQQPRQTDVTALLRRCLCFDEVTKHTRKAAGADAGRQLKGRSACDKVFVCLDIVGLLGSLSWDGVLFGLPELTALWANMYTDVCCAALNCVKEVVSDVRDPQTQPPDDGRVSDTTSQAAHFLEMIHKIYGEQAYHALMGKAREDQRAALSISGLSPFRALYQIVVHSMVATISKRQPMKAVEKQPALRHVYEANNFNFLLRSLRGISDLGPWVEQEFCGDLERRTTRAVEAYRDASWRRVLELLSQELQLPPGGQGLSDKQREQVKKAFKRFNEAFAARISEESSYNVGDPELRGEFVRAVELSVGRRYQEFYGRYADLDFTRHKAKYVRYTPAELSDTLRKLLEPQYA